MWSNLKIWNKWLLQRNSWWYNFETLSAKFKGMQCVEKTPIKGSVRFILGI